MSDYYDIDGNPITMMEWAESFDPAKKRVALELMDTYAVSTVWLGLNHRWGPGPPLIFETMVFKRDGEMLDEYMERYSTLEQALAGHAYIVEMVRLLDGVKDG